MDFRTPIQLQKGTFSLNQNHKILLIGSCFAEEIGKCLQRDKFPCDVNPFGVLYNPYSICLALDKLMSGEMYQSKDLFQNGGLWHSWMHHSSFSRKDSDECLSVINSRLKEASGFLKEASLLIITLGSNRCFRSKVTGEVVGNCHKVPEKNFEVVDLNAEEIFHLFSKKLSTLQKYNPGLRIIFTVSPIRYLKYGMHESMLGKSNLLMGVDMLQKSFCNMVSYFPSFEIMMDDLRDYRFYAEDMLHPSGLAVDYIYQCFEKCYFDSMACSFLEEWRGVEKALNHRPFNPVSESYRMFVENTRKKILQLKEKYPTISVDKELKLCTIILSKLQK